VGLGTSVIGSLIEIVNRNIDCVKHG